MDFARLHDVLSEFNSTEGMPQSMPSTVMEMLVPGYGTISQLVYRFFGFDIGILVSGWLMIWGLYTGGRYVYYSGYKYFDDYFSSSVRIDDKDSLYLYFMSWIAEHVMTEGSRSLLAVSRKNNGEDDVDAADEDVLDSRGVFNFEQWANNISPRYEPSCGNDDFYHEERYYRFSHHSDKGEMGQMLEKYVVIRCYGRSTKPIKDLLEHIKRWTLSKESKMTGVYRATGSSYDRYWNRQALRPSRPLHTVSLDRLQKTKVVTDINEYLHPATARWYSTRGIPHRRGYLFHGPPGTGKTSLSFALAGIFGLNIYCLSLNDKDLTESGLSNLFDQLPTRCIVLLEDIDSAGVRREEDPTYTEANAKDEAESTETPETSVTPETPKKTEEAFKRVFRRFKRAPKAQKVVEKKEENSDSDSDADDTDVFGKKKGVSLSALLNVIDGAASHEGHVLIMTTNNPEKLDAALIRPGRVDLQVFFTLATHEQIRNIFIRMYSTKFDKKTPNSQSINDADLIDPFKASSRPLSSASTKVGSVASKQGENDDFLNSTFPGGVILSGASEEDKLEVMAEQFANALPDKMFSPAEIQGFLLLHKRESRAALEGVGKWKEEVLEAKKKGKKVVGAK
jgi:chaperone BCS1